MAKYFGLLWVLSSPHDDNISCSLLALQGYRNKTAGYAAGEIFISLHGGSWLIVKCHANH